MYCTVFKPKLESQTRPDSKTSNKAQRSTVCLSWQSRCSMQFCLEELDQKKNTFNRNPASLDTFTVCWVQVADFYRTDWWTWASRQCWRLRRRQRIHLMNSHNLRPFRGGKRPRDTLIVDRYLYVCVCMPLPSEQRENEVIWQHQPFSSSLSTTWSSSSFICLESTPWPHLINLSSLCFA